MEFRQRRAVSPIIATLLLIAIAVASGVIVYVFTGSLAGSLTKQGGGQVSEQVEMLAYNFQDLASTTCGSPATTLASAGPCVEIYFKNTGTGTISLSSVYFDGSVLAEGASYFTTDATAAIAPGSNFVLVMSTANPTTCGVYTSTPKTGDCFYGGSVGASTVVAGSSHIVKLVTADGATFPVSVVAGSTG